MIIGSLLTQTASLRPDHVALVEGERTLTFREWNLLVNRVAHGLESLGIGIGDPVAGLLYNSIELATLYLATQKIGAVFVPLNFRLAANEVAGIVDDAGVKVLVYDSRLGSVVHQAAAAWNSPVQRITVGAPMTTDEYSWDVILGNSADHEPQHPIDPDDVSLFMYTSGTTGAPKGVVLSHRSQWINTLLCAIELGIQPDDVTLHIAPLYHVAAYHVFFLPHLLRGATQVLMRHFVPEAVIQSLATHHITTLLGVPTQYTRLADTFPDDLPTELCLRMAVTTGAPIQPRVADWVRRHLTPNLYNVYGLTESTSLITILPPDQWGRFERGNCLGRTLIGMETKVVDPENRTTVADRGEPGELVVRGPKLMDGYHQQAEKTKARLQDGWLYTGDIVCQDEDGFFYLIDRVDDMINSGGEKIFPLEVERILNEHPGISQTAVVGIDDPVYGQSIKAFIVPCNNDLTIEEIERYCKEHPGLANFKRPRSIEIVPELPASPSGKILKKILRGGFVHGQVLDLESSTLSGGQTRTSI